MINDEPDEILGVCKTDLIEHYDGIGMLPFWIIFLSTVGCNAYK